MSASPAFEDSSPLLGAGGRRVRGVQGVQGVERLEDLYAAVGGLVDEQPLAAPGFGPGSRERKLPLRVTFWAFVAQALHPRSSCRDAARRIEAWWRWARWRNAPTLSQEAYCKARARLPLAALEAILRQVAARLEVGVQRAEEPLAGRTLKVVDGTSVSMPDLPALQALWPQPSSQAPGCGFPLMKLVGLFSLASGALLERATGSLRQHDSVLFRSLWPTLKAGDVLLEDRGFCSFASLALLSAQGVDTLARLHQARSADLRQGRPLGPADRLVNWKKPLQRPPGVSPEDYAALPAELAVRLIGLEVKVRGWRTRRVVLATTLCDPALYPAAALRALYLRRWQIEGFFAQIKTLLGLEVLRAKSAAMIEKELLVGLIAYNLVRALMQRAAHLHRVPLERVSFQGGAATLRHFAPLLRAAASTPRRQRALVGQMLDRIAHDLVPARPLRSEPRVRKRRAKNYHLLTRPRHQMGRLPHRKIGTFKTSTTPPPPTLS